MIDSLKNIKKYLIFFILLVIFSISNVKALKQTTELINSYENLPYQVNDSFKYTWYNQNIEIKYKNSNTIEINIDNNIKEITLPQGQTINDYIFLLYGEENTTAIKLASGYKISNSTPNAGNQNKVFFYNICNDNYCPIQITENYINVDSDMLYSNFYGYNMAIGSSVENTAISLKYYNGSYSESSDYYSCNGDCYYFGSNINFLIWTDNNPITNEYNTFDYNFLQKTNIITNPITITKTANVISNWTYSYSLNINVDSDFSTSEYKNYCIFTDIYGNTQNKDIGTGLYLEIYNNQTISCYNKTISNEQTNFIAQQIIAGLDITQKTNMDANNLVGYLGSVDINYNYYTIGLKVPKYIPFKLTFVLDEPNSWSGTQDVITQFLGYYVDSNGNYQQTSSISLVNKKTSYNGYNWQITGYIYTGGFSEFKISFKVLRKFALIGDYSINWYDNTPNEWTSSQRNITYLAEDFLGYTYYELKEDETIAYIYKTNDSNSNSGNIIFTNYAGNELKGQWYYETNYSEPLEQTIYNSNYKRYSITFDYNNNKKIFALISTKKLNGTYTGFYVPNEWSVKIIKTKITESVPINNDNGTLGVIYPDANNNINNSQDYDIFSVVGNYIAGSGFITFSNHISKIVSEGFSDLPNPIQNIIIFSICLTLILALILSIKRW